MFNRVNRALLLGSTTLATISCLGEASLAQTSGALPTINVTAPKTRLAPQAQLRAKPTRGGPSNETPEATAARQLAVKAKIFDTARSHLYTTIGTTSYTISDKVIRSLPQGANQPVEKVLLQAPGVSQDSAASGLLHVRNDHANVQYRINGVMLPDGVTGFGSIFDTNLIGSMSLVTGALPAEFGMRTVGLIDMTTRTDVFNNSGKISGYGGSFGTIEPSFEYGGTAGGNCGSSTLALGTSNCFPGIQYYFTGRYLQTLEGIESATPGVNPIHDFSQQEKGFGYVSTFIDPTTRLSLITGTATSAFQIPNVPGQPVGQTGNPPVTSAYGITNFNSALLNETQVEDTQYAVIALQKSLPGFDGQLSYFTRYNWLHFVPDPIGDLLLNGIASNISRESYANGIQGDASYAINPAHTLRVGFTVSGEQSNVDNTSVVEPAPAGVAVDTPESITDNVAKVGWLAGVYAQDEWKVTNQFTINAGLRFDQMWQYTNDNQVSPRLSITYKPLENTTFHAGYARYFTPPVLVEAAPANIALFNGTSGAGPAGQPADPVKPERSNYFDAGVDQLVPLKCSSTEAVDCSTLDLGVDAYYKQATDLIDNGNFGQALVLTAFNYAEGITEGVEFSGKLQSGDFQAYGNVAVGQEKATDPVTNQYLFDNTTPLADLGGLTEFQYAQTHWISTDHSQLVTASAGASYLWWGTRFSADLIFGSGLRNGDDNISTVPAYTQVNLGLSHDFVGWNTKPLTLRFDIVNLFDTVYEIRDGTGIGVFAPQYGPRRGFYGGLTQSF
jgi:outer membrane receptor protein involved in Fe transport